MPHKISERQYWLLLNLQGCLYRTCKPRFPVRPMALRLLSGEGSVGPAWCEYGHDFSDCGPHPFPCYS